MSRSKAWSGCPSSHSTKLVTSTTLLIERAPTVSRRRTSQSGLGPSRTSSSRRAEYRGQSFASATSTRASDDAAAPLSGGAASGRRSGTPRSTAISRASPRWFMQSGRLPVMSTSSRASSPSIVTCSTLEPDRVSSARSWSIGPTSTYWASQSRENCISDGSGAAGADRSRTACGCWAGRSAPSPRGRCRRRTRSRSRPSGSIPTFSSTRGSTMPEPMISIQPVPEQVPHSSRFLGGRQNGQVMSTSADGSVNGK